MASNTSGIVGKPFIKDLEFSTLYDLYNKYNITGDKKLVLKTEIIKKLACSNFFIEIAKNYLNTNNITIVTCSFFK